MRHLHDQTVRAYIIVQPPFKTEVRFTFMQGSLQRAKTKAPPLRSTFLSPRTHVEHCLARARSTPNCLHVGRAMLAVVPFHSRPSRAIPDHLFVVIIAVKLVSEHRGSVGKEERFCFGHFSQICSFVVCFFPAHGSGTAGFFFMPPRKN